MLSSLMFMETSICGRLIAKKEHKLVKGTGFHLDVILVTLANVGCTVIGGSWVCAATVRSVAHATSLIVYSTNNAPGEKPVILGVQGRMKLKDFRWIQGALCFYFFVISFN